MTNNTKPTPPGRPRIYAEPRQRLTLELPQELVRQIDTLAYEAEQTRTAWIVSAIESAIREKLARDGQ